MKIHALTCVAVGLGALSSTALGGDVILSTYDLFDHTDGAIPSSAYGLRLDGFTTNPAQSNLTFSFGDSLANSTMRLQVVQTDTGTEIRMFGTVVGNSADGGHNFGTFDLNMTYTVDTVGNGWEAPLGDNPGSLGSIVGDFGNGNSNEIVNLFGNADAGDVFRFLADGHRLSSDNTSWVGRGWVLPNNMSGATNDFLFQAALVPLPTAAWAGLAMLGGIAAARRFRK